MGVGAGAQTPACAAHDHRHPPGRGPIARTVSRTACVTDRPRQTRHDRDTSGRAPPARSVQSGRCRRPTPRARARDLGIEIGLLPTGPGNAITDVPGVLVGHATVWRDEPDPPAGGVSPARA